MRMHWWILPVAASMGYIGHGRESEPFSDPGPAPPPHARVDDGTAARGTRRPRRARGNARPGGSLRGHRTARRERDGGGLGGDGARAPCVGAPAPGVVARGSAMEGLYGAALSTRRRTHLGV